MVSVVLVLIGIYALYNKWSKRVSGVAGLVSSLTGGEESGPKVRWTLPDDDGGVLLIKHANHTNVAEAMAAAYSQVVKQKSNAGTRSPVFPRMA